MIGDRRQEDTAENLSRLLEARGKEEREELGAVADLCDCDDHGRDEKRLHELHGDRARTTAGSDNLRPARVPEIGAKGLAKPNRLSAPWFPARGGMPSMLRRTPPIEGGRLLPDDRSATLSASSGGCNRHRRTRFAAAL
jgi:hypothetical protein